jgi:hypothetical protein
MSRCHGLEGLHHMKRHPISQAAITSLVLMAASCGTAVIGGVEPDPTNAGATTTITPDDAGIGDDCYACACQRLTTDDVAGCKDVCDGILSTGQPVDWCNGNTPGAECAACLAATCGVQDATQCLRHVTPQECACAYPSGGSPAGCADTCDHTISGVSHPDYCNGAPAGKWCTACMADRCGITLPSEPSCWECACSRTSGDTPMGCADTCDADIGAQATPNFCNGAAPHSQCDLCILDRCGVSDPSQCH